MKMNAILSVSVLCGWLVDFGSSVSCGSNQIGIDWTGSSSGASGSSTGQLSFETGYSSSECGQDVCSAASYDIDYKLTVNNFLGFDWWDWSIDTSFSLDAAFCGDEDVCDVLAGGQNECNAINFDFSLWYPTSCDNSTEADYDATEAAFNITYKYACCDTDDCNEDYDFSSCTFNTDLGNYVSELFDCWKEVRRDFMKYLVCDDDGGNDIFNFEGDCRESGSWMSDDDDCIYIPTCSEDIRTLLVNFGECACDAATDNNYPGVAIAEIMETQWSAYCPNLNLTCASDGSLQIILGKVYIYWTFYLDIDFSDISNTTRQYIREAIATAANVKEYLISIYEEIKGDTSTNSRRRRLQGDSTTSDEGSTITVLIEVETLDDAASVESNLNSNGDDQVTSKTGATASGGEASTETDSEYVAGGDSSSNNDDDSTTWIIVGVCVGIGVLIAAIVIGVYLRNRHIKRTDGEHKQSRLLAGFKK